MSQTASLPVDNPPVSLNSEQSDALRQATCGLNVEQLIWSSGYLAGLAAAHSDSVVPQSGATEIAETTAVPSEQLTILYGSQTGNGQQVAEQMYKEALQNNVSARLVNMFDYKARDIAKETWLALVVSTHGEGDAPDDAELLLEFLKGKRAPKLDQLHYFVLALGDSSYAQFCQTGHDFDLALGALGAIRVGDLAECDLDYEQSAEEWASETLSIAAESLSSSNAAKQLAPIPLQVVDTSPSYAKDTPFEAEVLLNQRITGRNSTKIVHHLELDLTNSGIVYEPGDGLAVVTKNPEGIVRELLLVTGFSGDTTVQIGEEILSLTEALTSRLEITATSGAFIDRYIELIDDEDLASKFTISESKKTLLSDYQIIDIVRKWPLHDTKEGNVQQRFVDTLRPLTPRVYSISSSSLATPDEVHITVAQVAYTAFDTPHWGSASTQLTQEFSEGDVLGLFIEANPRFRLPADHSKDVIMIGPGTGVAPFRAFIEHRAEQNASGKNWLIFGDRSFSDDFLYQTEWQKHLKDGSLHRLDLAFSRDQENKIYVQDRLKQHSAELFSWLERGAHVYVCGDATHMAPDVHEALIEIIKTESGEDLSFADNYVSQLKRQQRYQRDVY